MIQEQPTYRIIQTTQGQIPLHQLDNTKILFHQYLNIQVCSLYQIQPLNLQNLHLHRQNPFNLQNTSVTPGIIDHQLQQLSNRLKIDNKKLIILDVSPYSGKIDQIFNKYSIVRGYSYRIEGATKQNQKKVLLSSQHAYKQIQYQFKFGNGVYKPGFIGQILLQDCCQKSEYFQVFKAYLKYSCLTKCPIIINCNNIKKNPIFQNQYIDGVTQQNNKQQIYKQKWNYINYIINVVSNSFKQSKIVLFNPPILLNKYFQINNCQQKFVCSISDISSKLQAKNIIFGFDILRYNSNYILSCISTLCIKYPQNIIITDGVRFKTDLKPYGGQSYLFNLLTKQSNILNKMFKIIKNESILIKLSETKLKLISWKYKMQQIKQILTWKCSLCQKQQPQTIQSFRKFNKQFCSIKCLKSFKF